MIVLLLVLVERGRSGVERDVVFEFEEVPFSFVLEGVLGVTVDVVEGFASESENEA